MINELLAYLNSCNNLSSCELIHGLNEYPVNFQDLLPWAKFENDKYARNSVLRTDKYELLCLCWKGGQFSPIHGHEKSAAAVRVIHGIATETLYRNVGGKAVPLTTREHPPGMVYGEDTLIHKLGNSSEAQEDLVTLHVYAPPIQPPSPGYAGGRIFTEATEA